MELNCIAISDTHSLHKYVKVPECDILIHAGDISKRGKEHEIIDFLEWYSQQPGKYKILIAGNHDFYFDSNWKAQTLTGEIRHAHMNISETEIKTLLSKYPNIIYLNDSGIEIEGIKIWGSPIQPWFHDWAFNRMRGDDIKKHWDLIPIGTDILITHGPANGYGDYVPNNNIHVGCEELKDQVHFRIKPQVCIAGHIHEGYGVIEDCGIKFINASVLDEQYQCVNSPIAFTIKARGI